MDTALDVFSPKMPSGVSSHGEPVVLTALEERIDIYTTQSPTCIVNIYGHGQVETYDDILQLYSEDLVYFNALLLYPVEQCLLNTSVKGPDECSHRYSRWGKMKVFLDKFNESHTNSTRQIINLINLELAVTQSNMVVTNSKNTVILENPEYKKYSYQNQGSLIPRTPVNQLIRFDCVSSIDYVIYCNTHAKYNCTNEFSGLILPLIQIEIDLYTTGYSENSIKMKNPMHMPRRFADFSLFFDILAIQNMKTEYFDMIIQLLNIRINLQYNIVIKEISTMCEVCPDSDDVRVDLSTLLSMNPALLNNLKIIQIDMETIIMLFVLFLLISNSHLVHGAVSALNFIKGQIDGLNIASNPQNRQEREKMMQRLFKTIHMYSVYPLDFLSHACRPGREEIKRTITELARNYLHRKYVHSSSLKRGDSDDESDTATVLSESESDTATVLSESESEDANKIAQVLLRSARLNNTSKLGLFYVPQIPEIEIDKITSLLEKKNGKTIELILRRSQRIAKAQIDQIEKIAEMVRETKNSKKKGLQPKAPLQTKAKPFFSKKGGKCGNSKRRSKRSKRRSKINTRRSKRTKRTKRTKRNRRTKRKTQKSHR